MLSSLGYDHQAKWILDSPWRGLGYEDKYLQACKVVSHNMAIGEPSFAKDGENLPTCERQLKFINSCVALYDASKMGEVVVLQWELSTQPC